MTFLFSLAILAQFITPFDERIYLDAEGEFVIYSRYFQGTLVSIDTVKTIEDYISAEFYARNRGLLLRELKQDMAQSGGYANKGLFGTFEIPLPKGGFSDFMGETGKLDVGGYVKITLGGSETFVSNVPGITGPSLWPELEMNQEMAINLDGQVGDRVRVFIDHNSERINESQNKITVTYLGREDEIIQEIEGGDTELRIPATTYTGDIPSHRGLFGIKSSAKFGPLDLVAIASNEQTQHQEIDIEGSVQAQADTIWGREYQKRRFFWLGTNEIVISDSLEIYIDDNNFQNNNVAGGITLYGTAYVDVNGDDIIPDDTLQSEVGYFTLKLLEQDYTFLPNANIIELRYGLQKDVEVLGVKYSILRNGQIVNVGGVVQDTQLVLKLVCPKSPDTTSVTWQYELRNYYQVVSPGSRLDSLKIFYITPGGQHRDRNDAGETYLEVLGLDQNKDGRVDDYLGEYGFDAGRGLLIFRDSLPFASDTLDDPDFEIYENPYYMQGRGKYYLYKKTVESRPVFTLPPNVVDVTVYVDGVEQTEGVDYHVNLDLGELEFKKVIPPTARVKIHAEYAPFFSAAQKSLIGVRASMKTFGDASLGSSFFYRTESYPTDRVRLREEPFNRMVWEADLALPQSMPFLTRVVDWLPLVQTETESRMNLNVETAYSISNLNSEGEVYLDDLESSTIITNEISITYSDWVQSSKPVGMSEENLTTERLVWYNPRGAEVLTAGDIYLNALDPNETAHVLRLVFNPDNLSSFGGLMQYMYSENFDDCENLELIIRGNGGRLHVDLGQEMAEDQLRRNSTGALVGLTVLDDEDRDHNGSWNENTEDTGYDGVLGEDGQNVAGDDGNDDYTESDYTGGINGSEGNHLWNTEDIDRNGILNRDNIYYSYVVDLDSTQFLVQNAGLQDGWTMFRIPIKDTMAIDTVLGQPDWRTIRYVRIWLEDFSTAETLEIYRLFATGSRWKNYGVKGDLSIWDSSEVFILTPVNTRTHTYYESPFVEEKDPLTGQVRSEGALELRLENIREGHTCVAHRQTDDNEDYRAYDTLMFYMNALNSNPKIALRIGSDSVNYYAYETEFNNGVLVSGANGWRTFTISMERLLDLKQLTQGKGVVSDSEYTVVGNPSLSVNQFFEIAITNQNTTPLTDTIWFNDIKLVAPQTEIGRIIRATGSLNLADLASVTVSFDESNGRFKRLSESKTISTNSAGRNYAINSSIALHKFLLEKWGFSMPLTLNYRNSLQKPRFSYFADDLEITGDELEKQRSTNVVNSYTISLSKSGSRNWLIKNTLDALSFEHSRSKTTTHNALNVDTSITKGYRGTYRLDPRVSFRLLGQTFSVLPQNISFNVLYADNLVRYYYRLDPDSLFRYSVSGSQHRKTLNPSFSVAYSPHKTLNANFDFTQNRDSVSTRGQFGEEVGRNQTLNTTFTQDFKLFKPRLSFNASYIEDYRFEIRQDENLRNVSNSARYGIDGTVDLQRIVKFFTRLRDETKDSLASAGSPAWLAKQIEYFIERLQNPALSWSRLRNSNYLSVKRRPDFEYQFGLVDSLPTDDVSPNSYPGRGMTDSYKASSGLNLNFVTVNGAYNENITRTYTYGNIETRTHTTSYPNANLRVAKLEVLPFLKKYTHSSSINAVFNQTFESRFQDTVRQSDSKSISFTPLIGWQVQWVKGISSTIDVSYSETVSKDYQGAFEVPSKSLTRGASVSLGYTFSAPKGLGLPFLKGVRFSSNLALNLGVSYSQNTNYSTDLEIPIYDSSNLQGDLGLSYNFSSSITGGANFSYSQNKEKVRDQDTKRVGVNIWTNINF
ncbi:MAG: hypothetical protein JSV53_06565 [candidate division WOR-3 bacterium]|nr:MAG: hypothetical protein JSV53_06565 [candidate division WOR-3 bacterium]